MAKLAMVASLLSLGLFSAALSPAFAGLAAEPSFDVRSVGDELQQNTVTSIVQSKEGYLWFGTYHGLVRFDGVRSVVFNSGDAPGLCNGLITSLYEDHQGTLWIGHETGDLTRLSRGRFQPVPLGKSWRGGSIEAISSDENRDLWLLTDSGILFRVRDGKSVLCPGAISPSHKPVLSRARDEKLWIVSDGAIDILEKGTLQPIGLEPNTRPEYVERALPARGGGLWVLAGGHLRKWQRGRWVEELPGCPTEPGAVTVLFETHSGIMLAGTLHDGLYLLGPGVPPQRLSRVNGLSHDWIRTICQDREGNIWLGTGAGVDTLRPRKVQMLNAPDGWEGCTVLSFSVRPDGSAWVGTEGAGLYHYDGKDWTCFRESAGVSNRFVWSVLETSDHRCFVGTWGGGLFERQGDRFAINQDLAQITSPVLSMYEDPERRIWIGTTTGIYCYKEGKIVWAAGKEQLHLPDVRAITQSRDGAMWFGLSGGGLVSLKDGLLKQYGRKDGLTSDFVLCLYSDPEGVLWAGTADKGLVRLKGGRFSCIGRGQGIPSTTISHIVDDGLGSFWMGSQAGILRASKADLNRCADGLSRAAPFFSYGKGEGLATLACSGGFQPGACKTADGTLWFPTAKGLAVVNPADVTTNPVAPPVVIEALAVDGVPVWSSGEPHAATLDLKPGVLRIPPGRQRFEFHYTALSFTAPERVRFRYKLEGMESDWTSVGNIRSTEYNYLPPGKYRFHVIACNNDGIWNDQGASLAFTVQPFFWQTWWFRAFALACGAGGVGAGVLEVTRRRLRRKLEDVQRQRALERERARIARDIHDDLGASLTRITLLSQSAASDLNGNAQASGHVQAIYHTARELTRAMDEIVWAVNPRHDTLDSLVTYLGRFAQSFLSGSAIRCRLDLPLQLPPWNLTAEIRHNVFLAFKEALHNVVKHAAASEVRITLDLRPEGFAMVVADNGRGFQARSSAQGDLHPGEGLRASGGNGLVNMQQRLTEVGGRCEWDTAPNQGTRVSLILHIPSPSRVIKTDDNSFPCNPDINRQ